MSSWLVSRYRAGRLWGYTGPYFSTEATCLWFAGADGHPAQKALADEIRGLMKQQRQNGFLACW